MFTFDRMLDKMENELNYDQLNHYCIIIVVVYNIHLNSALQHESPFMN